MVWVGWQVLNSLFYRPLKTVWLFSWKELFKDLLASCLHLDKICQHTQTLFPCIQRKKVVFALPLWPIRMSGWHQLWKEDTDVGCKHWNHTVWLREPHADKTCLWSQSSGTICPWRKNLHPNSKTLVSVLMHPGGIIMKVWICWYIAHRQAVSKEQYGR